MPPLNDLLHDAAAQPGAEFLQMNLKSILKHIKKKPVAVPAHASRLQGPGDSVASDDSGLLEET